MNIIFFNLTWKKQRPHSLNFAILSHFFNTIIPLILRCWHERRNPECRFRNLRTVCFFSRMHYFFLRTIVINVSKKSSCSISPNWTELRMSQSSDTWEVTFERCRRGRLSCWRSFFKTGLGYFCIFWIATRRFHKKTRKVVLRRRRFSFDISALFSECDQFIMS